MCLHIVNSCYYSQGRQDPLISSSVNRVILKRLQNHQNLNVKFRFWCTACEDAALPQGVVCKDHIQKVLKAFFVLKSC